MTKNLSLGAQVYYTGDAANVSGHFEVVGEGENHVMLSEIDGDRTFHVYRSQIGDVYQGHCNPRFVTEEARQAYFNNP